MHSESSGEPGAREMLWRDFMEWASERGTIVHSDDSVTVLVARFNEQEETFKFGPEEWAHFVYHGVEGEVDAAVYHPRLSGYALDDLWETVGSKGSPIVIRDGEIARE